MKSLLLLSLLLFAIALPAVEESNWVKDLAAAKVAAVKEGKDILVLVDGSDWSPGSAQVAAVLDDKTLLEGIKKTYILVLIDIKKLVPQTDAEKEQANKFVEEFGLYTVPSFVFMDPNGRPYGFIAGMAPESTKTFMTTVDKLKENATKAFTLIDSARKETVAANKAKMLQTALVILNDNGIFTTGCLFGYDAEIAEIMKLDGDNSLHMRVTWQLYVISKKAVDLIKDKKYDDAITVLDVFIKEFPNESQFTQRALMIKAGALYEQGKPEEALEILKKVVEIDPRSPVGVSALHAMTQIKGNK